MKFLSIIIPLSILLLSPVLEAKEKRPERPRVGLALAGGGARGFSHVGVLKWLEEQRIPVDSVVGTSMGGLVAGLYATGRTAEETIQLLKEIDWEETLRSSASFSEMAFRRKEDQRELPVQMEVGLRNGFRLPAGLNPGHGVGLLLDRIAFPYSSLETFDDLPIPFRCVATDLLKGEQVVLSDGSLSRALRATMSVPGLFSPVEYEDKILVDGGILNNLPTDIARAMGVETVIAVDLQIPAVNKEEMRSLVGVVNRMLDVILLANMRPNARQADILLTTDVSGYSSFDFLRMEELIQRGYEEASRQAALLKPLALDEVAWQRYLGRKQSRRRDFQGRPRFLRVQGALASDLRRVEKTLQTQLEGSLDSQALHKALTRITGWGRYDTAGYHQVQDSQQEGLGIQVHSKEYGPPFFRPALEINGSEIDGPKLTLGARLTLLDLGSPKSEWRSDLSFGFRDRAATEFYRPLGQSAWFIAPRAFVERSTQLLFRDEKQVGDYDISSKGLGVDAGYSFGRLSEVRVGYEWSRQTGQVDLGDPLLPTLKGRVAEISARWHLDALNSPMIPTRGIRTESEASWFLDSPGNSIQFPKMETRLLAAKPLGERLSVLFAAQGGSTLAKGAPQLHKFTLGGAAQLGALGLNERRGNHYFYSSLGALWSLSPQLGRFFGTPYAAGWYGIGDAFDSQADPFHNVTAGLLTESKLGALFFGGSFGESGRRKLHFSLGRFF